MGVEGKEVKGVVEEEQLSNGWSNGVRRLRYTRPFAESIQSPLNPFTITIDTPPTRVNPSSQSSSCCIQ